MNKSLRNILVIWMTLSAQVSLYAQTDDEVMANASVRAYEDELNEQCGQFNGVHQVKESDACMIKVGREFIRSKPRFNSCGKYIGKEYTATDSIYTCIYSIDKGAAGSNDTRAKQDAQTIQTEVAPVV
jgi:hypothetical protein